MVISRDLGQLTKKDCWISSTVIGIFFAYGKFPGVIVENNLRVIFPDGSNCTLLYPSLSTLEAVIRGVRTYFATPDCCQVNLTKASLEKTGTPDAISRLILGKTFEVYTTCSMSINRIFYKYLNLNDVKDMIKRCIRHDVLLCTFDFNDAHLYTMIGYDHDVVKVIDVSHPELCIRDFPLKRISLVFHLET